MTEQDFQHLKLLAEVESLLADLRHWADEAPDWKPAQPCQILVRRLLSRTDALRVRLDAPLIVATLGGTGTGKSTLVNALLGSDISTTGRQRPTTRQPVMICRSGLEPDALGIDPDLVEVVHADLPALRELVLIDCPDPDTTEGEEGEQSNLARLRSILPHCDVLLVTSTQQKYRSARVADELATAAVGARLVFVQTHADVNEDVREDWRTQLASQYATGEMYFIDSLQALDDVQNGRELQGDFGRLSALLTRELAGAASHRIRRANLLDLVSATLAACNERLDEALPAVESLADAVAEHRAQLSDRLAAQMQGELLTSRRHWENRLRWAGWPRGRVFSPFSFAFPGAYQGLGGPFQPQHSCEFAPLPKPRCGELSKVSVGCVKENNAEMPKGPLIGRWPGRSTKRGFAEPHEGIWRVTLGVEDCEKPGGVVKRALIPGFPNWRTLNS